MINLNEGYRIPWGGGRTAALLTGINFQGDGPCPAWRVCGASTGRDYWRGERVGRESGSSSPSTGHGL